MKLAEAYEQKHVYSAEEVGAIETTPEYFASVLADETNVQKAIDLLEKLGIQAKTKYGNYRPTYDVLKDIGERWEQLKV